MNKEARELAARMEKQRKSVRREQMHKAAERRIEVEGIQDGYVLGRDEKGRKINLKIDFDGWKVILGRKVELINEIGPGFKEGDPIPRKVIYSSYDIYGAVRGLKHVRQTHKVEIARNEELFRGIDRLHAMLNTKGHNFDSTDLKTIKKQIEAYIAIISKKSSGYKLLAKWKLEKVPELLKEAIEESQLFKKRNKVSDACSLLTAFKNRYGTWRERQISKIDNYNLAREDGLRRMRDERLRNLLIDLSNKLDSENGFGFASIIVSDWEAIRKIRVAKRRITERRNDDALALITECGKSLPEWLRPGLREAYSFIALSIRENQNGWREKARKMLENFARYLGQRNTKYIQIGLVKTQDTYLKDAISCIDKGNTATREAVTNKELQFWRKKKLVKEAASHFRQAAIRIAVV